jgi:hypothetical protein
MDVPESEKRFQLQRSLRRGRHQFELDQDLIVVGSQYYAFRKNYSADLVRYHRYGVRIEIDYVLVPPGFIYVPIAMNAQIELLAIYEQTLVKGRKKQIFLSAEIVDRDGKQTVIPPCIASDD